MGWLEDLFNLDPGFKDGVLFYIKGKYKDAEREITLEFKVPTEGKLISHITKFMNESGEKLGYGSKFYKGMNVKPPPVNFQSPGTIGKISKRGVRYETLTKPLRIDTIKKFFIQCLSVVLPMGDGGEQNYKKAASIIYNIVLQNPVNSTIYKNLETDLNYLNDEMSIIKRDNAGKIGDLGRVAGFLEFGLLTLLGKKLAKRTEMKITREAKEGAKYKTSEDYSKAKKEEIKRESAQKSLALSREASRLEGELYKLFEDISKIENEKEKEKLIKTFVKELIKQEKKKPSKTEILIQGFIVGAIVTMAIATDGLTVTQSQKEYIKEAEVTELSATMITGLISSIRKRIPSTAIGRFMHEFKEELKFEAKMEWRAFWDEWNNLKRKAGRLFGKGNKMSKMLKPFKYFIKVLYNETVKALGVRKSTVSVSDCVLFTKSIKMKDILIEIDHLIQSIEFGTDLETIKSEISKVVSAIVELQSLQFADLLETGQEIAAVFDFGRIPIRRRSRRRSRKKKFNKIKRRRSTKRRRSNGRSRRKKSAKRSRRRSKRFSRKKINKEI